MLCNFPHVLVLHVLLLLRDVTSSCELDGWGQPVPGQDPTKVFSVPAIMPLHFVEKADENATFYIGSAQGAEAVLYTVSYINRHLLNDTGFCVQSRIVDNDMLARLTVSLGMKQVGRLSQIHTAESCPATERRPPVVGILGPATSDNAIALANLCNVLKIPQISFAATSLDLDDTAAYPYFLRTVPSDQIQARAILEIISQSVNWNYIGIIASDDIYGGAGLSALLTHANKIQFNREFCIAFQYKLESPKFVASQVLEHIKETELSVIVLFSGIRGAGEFFKYLSQLVSRIPDSDTTGLRDKVLNVVYIGSESWSTDPHTFESYHGEIFNKFIGVGVYTRDIRGFREHLSMLNDTNYNPAYQTFAKNYFLKWYHKYTNSSTGVWKDDMMEIKLDDHTSTTADAAHAFGEGLRQYISERDIVSSFETNTSELFDVLKNINFTSISGNEVSFGSTTDQHVGRYHIFEYERGAFKKSGIYSHQTLTFDNPYRDHPSICSSPCQAGEWRKSVSPCCHECVKCGAHHYSNGSTSECFPCNETYTNNMNHTGCIPVISDHIGYSSTFAVILYMIVTVGVTLIGLIMTVFLAKFHTPVVQGHGIFIYFTILVTCLTLMLSCLIYVGPPSDFKCNVHLGVTYVGISTLFICVLCLSETVILKLKSVSCMQVYILQLTILLLGIALQTAITTAQLYFQPHQYHRTEVKRGVVYGECVKVSDSPPIDILALTSFFSISLTSLILSFLGRNITENFNEGKFLAFQTIAMHIVMVAFIPTKLLLQGPILSGAWVIFVLIMCYVVIIVMFVPKLYIIMYRPYKNQFIADESTDLSHAQNVIDEEETSEVSEFIGDKK